MKKLLLLLVFLLPCVATAQNTENPKANQEQIDDLLKQITDYLAAENYEKSFELCHQALELGSPEAAYYLSLHYGKGSGVARDTVKSIELMQKAMDMGDVDAMAEIAHVYSMGSYGYPQDYQKAVEYFTEASQGGSAFALFQLGFYYLHGIEVEQDLNKGISLIKSAADSNLSEAQLWYANYLLGSPNSDSAYSEAFNYVSSAAEQGNLAALAMLGRYYISGVGVPPDTVHAIEIYKSLSDANYGEGMFLYGAALYDGFVPGGNAQEGIEFIKRAAQANYAEAQYQYGRLLIDNNFSNPEIQSEGFEYIRAAANQTNYTAIEELGRLYMSGIGVEQNTEKALDAFKYLYELGLPIGKYLYGWMILEGHTDEDENFAIELLTAASNDGVVDASAQLAAYYFNKNNLLQHYHYIEIAALGGNSYSQYRYGQALLEGGIYGESNKEKAIFWLRSSAEQGVQEAISLLENIESGKNNPQPQNSEYKGGSNFEFKPRK